MINPFAALRSACLSVADNEAGEIEFEWSSTDAAGHEHRLLISVRREPRALVVRAVEEGDIE